MRRGPLWLAVGGWRVGWALVAVGSAWMAVAAGRAEAHWFWWNMRHGGAGYFLGAGFACVFISSARASPARSVRRLSIVGLSFVGLVAIGYWLSPPGGYFPSVGELFIVPFAVGGTMISLLVCSGLRLRKEGWRAVAFLLAAMAFVLAYQAVLRDWPIKFQVGAWVGLAVACIAPMLALGPGPERQRQAVVPPNLPSSKV